MCTFRFDWNGVLSNGATCLVNPNGTCAIEFTEYQDLQENNEFVFQFGSFRTGAHRYAVTPRGLIQGARKRLFGVRNNDIAFHRQLVKNQENAVKSKGCDEFRKFFAENLKSRHDAHDREIIWLALPNPRRKLRKRTKAKSHAKGRFVQDRRKYTDYKPKPGEMLAAGKQLRAIGEISLESAFEHGPSANEHKLIYAKPFYHQGAVSCFIMGPTDEELDRAFKLLTDSSEWLRFIYFSDDSCVAVQCTDGLFLANIDFKWSDGSMFYPAFNYAKSVWTQDELAKGTIKRAFKQCTKPIRLINRVKGFELKSTIAKHFIEIPLKKGQYVLPSGFSGTTLMNNNSQVIYFSQLTEHLRPGMTRAAVAEQLTRAAHASGLDVKIDICECVEDLQFLKHSWALDTSGVYKPYVNLACWLRGYGQVDGHVQFSTKLTFEQRMTQYTSDIMRSRDRWGATALSDVFTEAYPLPSSGANEHLLESERYRSGITGCRLQDESVCRRYRLDPGEYYHFLEMTRLNLRVGTHISHPVIGKIMMKDYGYMSSERLPLVAKPVKFVVVDGVRRQDVSPAGF